MSEKLNIETEVYPGPAQAKQRYCLGFLFSTDRTQVALIEHQVFHKLNGIGGKLEAGELPADAMSREFLEETGAFVAWNEWREYAQLGGPAYHIACFVAVGDRLLQTKDSGRVTWYRVDEIFVSAGLQPLMDNLSYLIPMALDKNISSAVVKSLK